MCYVLLFVLMCFAQADLFAQQPAKTAPATNRAAEMTRLATREAELSALQSEVAELRAKLGVDQQLVCIKAKVFELSHSRLKAQGVDVSKGALTSNITPRAEPDAQSVPWAVDAEAAMKQLETWLADPAKPAKLIASPTLTTPLGKAAFVNIGGEFPIVVPQSLGTTTIEYRRYGTQLDAIATKTEEGAISLQVRPRVSWLDPSRDATLNGRRIPGLLVRECDLSVTLRPAQTLMVTGLIQTRTNAPKQVGRRGVAQPATIEEIEMVMVITVDFVPSESRSTSTADAAAKPTPAIVR